MCNIVFVHPENAVMCMAGNEGRKICSDFLETAVFESYGVKSKGKSQYANEFSLPTVFRALLRSTETTWRTTGESSVLQRLAIYRDKRPASGEKIGRSAADADWMAVRACAFLNNVQYVHMRVRYLDTEFMYILRQGFTL